MNQPQTTGDPAGTALDDEIGAAQFVGFSIDRQEFAFAIGGIQEIIVLNDVTPIPQVEDYVEGVTNLRGDIIPVVNLRLLFGMPALGNSSQSRVIVVNTGEKTVGCRVDAVSQVLSIPDAAVEPAPELITGDANRYVQGLAKLENRIIILLNSDELLNPENLEAVRANALSAIAVSEHSEETQS